MAYDALLLVSFGGPEGPEQVLPFLRNVTAGRDVPTERLREVATHYQRFGGVSPINAQNRALRAAIEVDFGAQGVNLPVYWGNRNWHPMLTDTVRRMAADGVRRALAFVTSAYSSYSGCRQYREDIAGALRGAGATSLVVDRLRQYFNHPGFVEPLADATRAALARVPPSRREGARLAFTAHSIPTAMATSSGPAGGDYPRQLAETASLVADLAAGPVAAGPVAAGPVAAGPVAAGREWALVYQSRSGSPGQPWLGPDVLEHLDRVSADGVCDLVLVPIGFVSDHLEVVYDLDVEARRRADELGVTVVRAATPGTDPRFVAMVRELVLERLGCPAERRALGRLGPSHDRCPGHCCPPPSGRARLPAVGDAR